MTVTASQRGITVEGVVTGDFQEGDSDTRRNLSGFYIQGTPDGDAGPKSYKVLGFARMYLEGCTSDLHNAFYADCDWNGVGNFTIHARYVEQVSVSNATDPYPRRSATADDSPVSSHRGVSRPPRPS